MVEQTLRIFTQAPGLRQPLAACGSPPRGPGVIWASESGGTYRNEQQKFVAQEGEPPLGSGMSSPWASVCACVRVRVWFVSSSCFAVLVGGHGRNTRVAGFRWLK